MLVRIITALVLAPLALAAIYGLGMQWFALVIAAIVALGAFEWAGLVFAQPADAPPSVGNNPFAAAIVALVFVSLCLAICFVLWTHPSLHPQWLMITAGCWLWAILEVLLYPRQAQNRRSMRWIVFGLIVLPGAWLAMVLLRNADPHLLVMACFLVWGADAGAYFVGKAMGQHKLAPKVSPGKTWEGAIGGGLVGLVVAFVFGWLMIERVQLAPFATAALLVGLVIVSVFGDLFESILKRTAGAKDSGRLLPGHGGILDRVDALIAVLPLMALASYLAVSV